MNGDRGSASAREALVAALGDVASGLPPGTTVELPTLRIAVPPGAAVPEIAEAIRLALAAAGEARR
jgi:hypothetical protein